MHPNISEFSYGFAVTDELIYWHGTSITAAPVFPSLYQEGQQGGGYDVMIQRDGIPLFLQFKLSYCMVRQYAREAHLGLLPLPYYRMYLRPAKHSNQHEMLLDLETAGNEVYYSAPAFHQSWELNEAYLKHIVISRSEWIRPWFIGPLPDDDEHYIAFKQPNSLVFCSEPKRIQGKYGYDDFKNTVLSRVEKEGKVALKIDNLSKLANTIAEISQKRIDIPPKVQESTREELRKRHPLAQIAFYALTYLDTQLFIVQGK